MIEEPEIIIDEDHVYTVNGKHPPSVTKILSTLGFSDFSMVPPHLLEAARIRGTAVHDCIQFIEENDLDWSTVHPEVRPYLDAFMLFREHAGYRTKVREKKIHHAVLNYCGRLDAIADMVKMGIENAVCDYKSGVPQPGTRYQLVAYAMAESVPFAPRFSIHLKRTGKYSLIQHKDTDDVSHWKAIATTYHVLKQVLNGGKK